MTTMEEFENSLYYLHTQLILWLKGEELKLKPTLHKFHKQRISTTADALLELVHDFFKDNIENKRFTVQIGRALSTLMQLVKKHAQHDPDSIFLEYQEEIETLSKRVIELTQKNSQAHKSPGTSNMELNELLK